MIKVRQNLREVATIALCLAGSATMFAQETGVKIGETTWATRNVDNPGTFATNPWDAGKFYQWNGTTAYPATGNVSGWDNNWNGGFETPTVDDKWTNNICPEGWTLPTRAQIDELLTFRGACADNCVQINGVNGRQFVDGDNVLFLPAVGIRSDYNGTLANAGWSGNYWSSTPRESTTNTTAYGLLFDQGGTAEVEYFNRGSGLCVRCVKDGGNVGVNTISVDTENAVVTGYFDIMGRELKEEPKQGLYIIRYSNGTAKKVMR